MDPTVRLRLATRIHFALLRHYDENVSVSTLLKGEDDAMEALWVCEASGHDELVALAQQFNSAMSAERAAAAKPKVVVQPEIAVSRAAIKAPIKTSIKAPRAATPQEMAWSQDTSGFGLSRLSEFGDAQTAIATVKAAHWMSPATWLRRTISR
jgi:hypothetical protein